MPASLTTFFLLPPISDYVAHLDGYTIIPGGWLNGHYIQLAYQLADSVSGFTYSFGGTCIILAIMNLIPGLSLRATDNAERGGIDDAEIGEFAVCAPSHLCFFDALSLVGHHTNLFVSNKYDYVEHEREYGDRKDSLNNMGVNVTRF